MNDFIENEPEASESVSEAFEDEGIAEGGLEGEQVSPSAVQVEEIQKVKIKVLVGNVDKFNHRTGQVKLSSGEVVNLGCNWFRCNEPVEGGKLLQLEDGTITAMSTKQYKQWFE